MLKPRVILLLALCAAALLSVNASAAHRPAKKPAKASAAKLANLQLVGDSDNIGMYDSPDPGQPAEIAQRLQDLGMNTERLYVKWSPDHPRPSGDERRQLCNAATQAALHGISNLIFSLPPLPDRQPLDDAGRAPYYAAWQSYFADLFDPVGGCVSGNDYWNGIQIPKLDHLYAEPLNESNDLDFCRPQTDTTHDLCADLSVQMRAYIYPRLKQLGQQYGVQVIVLGGALSSHHDPKGYIQAECTAMQRHGITAPNMDMYAFHPYQLPGTGKIFQSGFTLFQKLKPLIQKCYGSLPFIFDEAGLETAVPDGMGYTCSSPQSVIPYDDAHRAWDYQVMLNLSRKLGAVGMLNFMLQDEQCLNPGWQSGFYYWDGSPKPNLSDIRNADLRALGLS